MSRKYPKMVRYSDTSRVEMFLQMHRKQGCTSLLSEVKHSVLCATEMCIIEEYERNLQLEQQYISSVVEGMEQMHVICPMCHT